CLPCVPHLPCRAEVHPLSTTIVHYLFSFRVIHNFLICALLLRILTQCSLHAWGEQASIKKQIRTYHPAFKSKKALLRRELSCRFLLFCMKATRPAGGTGT